MSEELPVLIAAVTAQVARDLEEASRAGRDVWVPLEREPTQGGAHVLEVYTAEMDAPIRLLAEPLGQRSEHGSALRLRPWPAAQPEAAARTSLADGRFELLSLIGEGSIGAVYRARHTGLNRTVAVKVLHGAFQQDAEFCLRFYGEALAMSRLNHANLINIHDFGQEPDGLLYIAMSCVEGHTLRELQQRERRFDMPRIVAWMLQVCAGLGHAHARGLIHRDVKPDNLMLVTTENDDGERVETIKILDFGFAVPPSVSGEVAQRLAGTPVYMAPEQSRGEELDARSDLYACGVMMFELAAGHVPFLSHDLASLRQMHASAPVPLISATRPDIDPRYERIVQRALAKRREDRHASMLELRAELKALLVAPDESPPPSIRIEQKAPPSTPEPPPSSARPVSPPSSDDDWLERGTGYDIQSAKPGSSLADTLARDTSSFLGELSRERNPRSFTRRVEELEAAVRVLAERGDAKTLTRVSAVVSGLSDRIRDESALGALSAVARLFVNPDLLTPIASHLLLRDPAQDPARDAKLELLAQARISGVLALYGARTSLGADAPSHARVAFVTTMKSLGTSARPVLRSALERIYEQAASGHRAATELAEDVLLSVPKGDDELAGRLAMKFAATKVPSVARAAARALARAGGIRARAALLSLLRHEDDGVCMAAVVGLHEIDSVDLEAVALMSAQVDAGRTRTLQVKKVFMGALQSPTPSARAEALALLGRLSR